MKVYTGNFANLKKYLASGLFPISIAITSRYFTGEKYRPLNPDREFMNDPENIYTPKFNKKLNLLDPKKVFEDISKISNNKDVILLCHEGENDFCHRHLVSKWMNQRLGTNVIELGKMQKKEQQIK